MIKNCISWYCFSICSTASCEALSIVVSPMTRLFTRYQTSLSTRTTGTPPKRSYSSACFGMQPGCHQLAQICNDSLVLAIIKEMVRQDAFLAGRGTIDVDRRKAEDFTVWQNRLLIVLRTCTDQLHSHNSHSRVVIRFQFLALKANQASDVVSLFTIVVVGRT